MARSADTSWYLSVDITEETGALVLAAAGRLGRAGSSLLAQALNDALDRGFLNVVVDLGKVDYVSSAGLRTLESAAARLRSTNGTLTIRRAEGSVKMALDLAGGVKDVRREPE